MIAHIDMDAFFAKCEELRSPELEGRPVVICVYTRGKSSGAVSTANYAARDYGIGSGIPLSEARKKAPEEAVFLPVDHENYREKSEEVFSIVRSFSPEVQRTSIDEAYFRIEGNVETKARKIKAEIETLGLTCSIGISKNKFLAKLCSEEDKPDGLKILPEGEVQDFLREKEVIELHGVGEKTASKLENIDVKRISDLKEVNNSVLLEVFGQKKAAALKRKSRGIGSRNLESGEPKQMSKIKTMEKNSSNYEYIETELAEAATNLYSRIEEKEKAFNNVGIVIKDSELNTYTRSRKVKTSESWERLFSEARNLLENFLDEYEVEVRRIGIRVSDLVDRKKQTSLQNF